MCLKNITKKERHYHKVQVFSEYINFKKNNQKVFDFTALKMTTQIRWTLPSTLFLFRALLAKNGSNPSFLWIIKVSCVQYEPMAFSFLKGRRNVKHFGRDRVIQGLLNAMSIMSDGSTPSNGGKWELMHYVHKVSSYLPPLDGGCASDMIDIVWRNSPHQFFAVTSQ